MPSPKPDELLYSLIARAARYLGHWSPKGLCGAVYGRPSMLACPDLPGALSLLEGQAADAWHMSPRQMALDLTLAGYYTHFLGEEGRNRVVDDMLTGARHLHVRLGICAATARAPSYFRLCPVCTREDMACYGETYWRRCHHVPGVLVCPVHGVPLHESSVRFRPVGRHEHVAAHPRMLASGFGPLPCTCDEAGTALALARANAALLDGPATCDGPLHDYRAALCACGYLGRHGDLQRLRADVLSAFGGGLLLDLFKARAPEYALQWLGEVVRTPRRRLHPLKHVLLREFLRLGSHAEAPGRQMLSAPKKTWGIYRSSALREEAHRLAQGGLKTNAVARAMNIDWKTADRLLAPLPAPDAGKVGPGGQAADMQAWLRLGAHNAGATRTQLRRAAPALYARLYRADRQWLLNHGPARATPVAAGARVDWVKRDRALVLAIKTQIRTIVSASPAVRASRSRVLGVLGMRAIVAHYGHKLPMTEAVLRVQCESVRDFQLRRLRLAIATDASDSSEVPAWRALRVARINASRLPDGGKALLAAARLSAGGRPARGAAHG